jgi:2,4-dienoyl-CoA reductase-like NADH-dependent reductase (Old Yellow Enzyme family)
MPHLFDPLTVRGVTFRNRIGISPMQQYCANEDGRPTAWHLATILPRAAASAAWVFTESTSVVPDLRFFGYFGDVGFGLRAHLAGFKLVCAKGAWLWHRRAGHVMADAIKKSRIYRVRAPNE